MKAVTRKGFQDYFCKTCVYYNNGCTDDMRRNKNLCIIYVLAKMTSDEESDII